MKTAIILHIMRTQARILAEDQPFEVEVEAFVDESHFDGPRYYCYYRVPSLNEQWVDAGEAETSADALGNLSAALLMVRVRRELLETEFFSGSGACNQSFSELSSGLTASQLVGRYRQADTAAQLAHVRKRAMGLDPRLCHAAASVTFAAVFKSTR